jgi:hypothetical protein
MENNAYSALQVGLSKCKVETALIKTLFGSLGTLQKKENSKSYYHNDDNNHNVVIVV